MTQAETIVPRPSVRSVLIDPRSLQEATGSTRVPLLTQYLAIIVRRRWLILGIVATALLAGLIFTLLSTKFYTAASTIEIQREGDRIVKVEGVERETTVSDLEFYQTQYGLLKSRSLAERVARTLKLADDPKFVDTYRLQPKPGAAPMTGEQRNRAAGQILLNGIAINPVRASRLVQLAYTSADPTLSARISNAWGANFIEANLERRYESTAYARKFLEGRLEQLRQRLEESERQLVGYAGSQKIINIPTATVSGGGNTQTSGERSLVADDLAAINTELGQATADRIRAESRLRGARGAASPEALTNSAIGALRQKRAEAAADYAKLMVQFEPGYPAARALASQIAQLDTSIAREEGRVSSSIDANYREALARETDLHERVEGLKTGLLDLKRRSIQYNIYQRDVDTNRQLYDGLLQRYKEIGIAGGVGNNNISIVDTAEVPTSPSRPNLFTNLALAMLLGLGLAAVTVFALEQMDEAIADPADVERAVGLPLLGTVPDAQGMDPILALEDRKSSLVEAYLSVSTSLEFATDHGTPKSIMITSTRPAEGKSASAYALAQTMARSRRRVVLVDCDMRSPSVHGLFRLDNARGVSNFLTGSNDIEALVRSSGQEGLSVLTSGPQPPNAAELLTGDRLSTLIARLLETHDNVVIDSPPVMGLADAPLIASKVEGVVFAIESHVVRVRLVRVALARLVSANARILGVMLTKFDTKRTGYGYGYGYEYGYGYGETRSEPSS